MTKRRSVESCVVPLSIRSSLVTTAIDLSPSGSIFLGIFKLSNVDESVFAVMTAKKIEFDY